LKNKRHLSLKITDGVIHGEELTDVNNLCEDLGRSPLVPAPVPVQNG
jgi:hypothetical protein